MARHFLGRNCGKYEQKPTRRDDGRGTMTESDRVQVGSSPARHAADRSGIVTDVAVREQSVADTTGPSDEIERSRGMSGGVPGGSTQCPRAGVYGRGSKDPLVKGAALTPASTAKIEDDDLVAIHREREALRERVRLLERRLLAIESVCKGGHSS